MTAAPGQALPAPGPRGLRHWGWRWAHRCAAVAVFLAVALLLGLGGIAWWCAGDLPARRRVFAALAAMVVIGGLGRLLGLLLEGVPPWPHVAALEMELGVVPALWLWSRRVD